LLPVAEVLPVPPLPNGVLESVAEGLEWERFVASADSSGTEVEVGNEGTPAFDDSGFHDQGSPGPAERHVQFSFEHIRTFDIEQPADMVGRGGDRDQQQPVKKGPGKGPLVPRPGDGNYETEGVEVEVALQAGLSDEEEFPEDDGGGSVHYEGTFRVRSALEAREAVDVVAWPSVKRELEVPEGEACGACPAARRRRYSTDVGIAIHGVKHSASTDSAKVIISAQQRLNKS
jgi:hypothetical protein